MSGNAKNPEVINVVGDSRRVRVFSIDLNDLKTEAVLGEVWQEKDGTLRGTGVAAVMLFEKMSNEMYRSASIKLNLSPLSIFYARVSRMTFSRAEFV